MDLSHYSRFLSHLPLFRGLSESEIVEIARTLEIDKKSDGDIICAEGDPANGMYVAETGAIEVRKNTAQGDTRVLARIEAPTVVGEMALLDGAPRSATLVARGNVSLYRVDLDAFNHLRRNWSPAAYKVIRNLALTLCGRLRDTNDKINGFFKDPEGSLRVMQERQKDLWVERQRDREGGEA